MEAAAQLAPASAQISINDSLQRITAATSTWQRNAQYFISKTNNQQVKTYLQAAIDSCNLLDSAVLTINPASIKSYNIDRIKQAERSIIALNLQPVNIYSNFSKQTEDLLYIIIQLSMLVRPTDNESLKDNTLLKVAEIAYEVKKHIKKFQRVEGDIAYEQYQEQIRLEEIAREMETAIDLKAAKKNKR